MLEPIVAATERRLPDIISREDQYRASARVSTRSMTEALAAPGLSVIAEVKRRSPSRGVIRAGLDPAELARQYEAGGAAAISVLTEPEFFDGSPDDLRAVREVVGLPVLRKDFIIHPAQVWETAALGADALLLIVAILDDATLRLLAEEAAQAGLASLVEVHTDAELDRAQQVGATLVGVNNRDLATFEVDLATAERLAGRITPDTIKVAESGIFTSGDARRMASAGFDAVLVGESLVRSDRPGELIEMLRRGSP